MIFANLEQRMAHSYIALLADYKPDADAPVSASVQEAFYTLMKALYQLAFDEPAMFVPVLHEDDAFPNRFNKTAYSKQRLQADMKKFTKAVDALLHAMFLLGQGAGVSLNQRQRSILSRLGIDEGTGLPAAWTWMSTKKDANLSKFAHCLFDDAHSYTSGIYARLLGEGPFKKLENWMLDRGYKRFDIYRHIASDCDLSLSIANPAWSADPPRGGFEYKIRHTGISARFDAYAKNPPVIGLCIPNGMKTYLEAFDEMDPALAGFIVSRTKKCDNCGYCVQTDKTGARPKAYTPVKHAGIAYNLCTYYPGYNYCWSRLDDDIVDKLIDMLSFMDRFAPGQN